jgi:hypothetical protein
MSVKYVILYLHLFLFTSIYLLAGAINLGSGYPAPVIFLAITDTFFLIPATYCYLLLVSIIYCYLLPFTARHYNL